MSCWPISSTSKAGGSNSTAVPFEWSASMSTCLWRLKFSCTVVWTPAAAASPHAPVLGFNYSNIVIDHSHVIGLISASCDSLFGSTPEICAFWSINSDVSLHLLAWSFAHSTMWYVLSYCITWESDIWMNILVKEE